jgi:hypothetical protein
VPIITTIRGNTSPFGKRSRLFDQSTGGTIQEIGGYRIHTFTSLGNSTFTPTSSGSVQYLIVGAGGGASGGYGGVWYGPGAASGVVRTGTTSVTPQAYTVTVGTGGSASNPTNRGTGGNGGISSFNSINATGGNGAGEGPAGSSNADYSGSGSAGDGRFASVGGGAGAGGNASGPRGGIGVYNSLSGTSVGYGGGGAGGTDGDGGSDSSGAPGDAPLYGGGCGRSSYSPQYQGIDGKGGGAAGANSGLSFRGGHGIVIIRYPF